MKSGDAQKTARQQRSRGKTPAHHAAMYVRTHATEQYLIDMQIKKIRAYAEERKMKIVKTYTDKGAQADKHPNLKRLISDIRSGTAEFKTILMLNARRWESARWVDRSRYYESLCRRKGIQIGYALAPDEIQNAPFSSIMKAVYRAMD